MKLLVTFLFAFVSYISEGQAIVTPQKAVPDAETEKYWSRWTEDLYVRGVEMKNDSVKFNNEARLIVADSNYRKIIYPEQYHWQDALLLMKRMELKKSFWYMINIYAADTANKRIVINALLPFDQLYEMDKVMLSTFYTYALLDPQIYSLKDGKPQITKPALAEKKFNTVKEIIGYIQGARKDKLESSSGSVGKQPAKK